MGCPIADLRNKQVVCIKDGSVLGFIYDVELDVETGKLISLIVPGRARFFGIFGREEDMVISWDEIEVIGQETVLVSTIPPAVHPRPRRRFFDN